MTTCAGAAEFGTQLYGAAGSQQAQPGSNVILMKGGKKSKKSGKKSRRGGNILGDMAVPAALVLANHSYKKNRKGGNVVSDVAVPAALVLANHSFGNKNSSKKNGGKVSRKNRKSRRLRKTSRR